MKLENFACQIRIYFTKICVNKERTKFLKVQKFSEIENVQSFR